MIALSLLWGSVVHMPHEAGRLACVEVLGYMSMVAALGAATTGIMASIPWRLAMGRGVCVLVALLLCVLFVWGVCLTAGNGEVSELSYAILVCACVIPSQSSRGHTWATSSLLHASLQGICFRAC